MQPERTDRVPLPHKEPRCAPSHGCTASMRCARARAEIPRYGTLADWTIASGKVGDDQCKGFVQIVRSLR